MGAGGVLLDDEDLADDWLAVRSGDCNIAFSEIQGLFVDIHCQEALGLLIMDHNAITKVNHPILAEGERSL